MNNHAQDSQIDIDRASSTAGGIQLPMGAKSVGRCGETAAAPDARTGRGGRRLADTSMPGGVEHYESDDRFTSPDLVCAMEESFGRITIDPCWHEASAVRPIYSFDVRRGQNGLLAEWFGDVAFVNPPWSAQNDWVRRGHDQWARRNVRKVLCLVPAATSAAVFHEILSLEADVFFLKGRPRFSKVDGTSEGTMHNTMLVAFGATLADKARFAARVRGSWWRPDALSTRSVDIWRSGGVAGYWRLDLVSCVAKLERGVSCGPVPAL